MPVGKKKKKSWNRGYRYKKPWESMWETNENIHKNSRRLCSKKRGKEERKELDTTGKIKRKQNFKEYKSEFGT